MAASVHTRLHNRRAITAENYESLLRRYAAEGFIRRLAASPHRQRFVLKGAMLFVVWGLERHRATRDIDFLGLGELSLEPAVAVFRDIVSQQVDDDGLVILPESIKAELIREENEYGGTRVTMIAMLPPARIPMQVDVGIGDAALHCPTMEFPPLLPDSPGASIRVYTKETVIAEKFHALVEFGMSNSRMKDFFDIWTLSNHFEFELQSLVSSVRATFTRRGLAIPTEIPSGLTERFSGDMGKQTQWRAFLRKGSVQPPHADLTEVVGCLADFLDPVRVELLQGSGRTVRWKPGDGSWF